jgi:hypothetical protein
MQQGQDLWDCSIVSEMYDYDQKNAHPKHPPMTNASIQVNEGNILADK